MKAQENRLASIVQPLLLWYRKNARVLPWRENPEPYRVWVSEIMLQQTRVEAVKPYFDRFLEALPDIPSLAACPEELLLKLWEGLGYYSRVRNLQKAARMVMELYGGELPSDPKTLQKLPGIGEYTAGAVASIAYGLPVPAVDGNVLRVVTRVLADPEDITQKPGKDRFRQMVQEIEPEGEAGDFNQALMELGATVCLPNGAPKCLECPLRELCRASQEGSAMDFPVKPAKKARRIEEKSVFLLADRRTNGDSWVLLHRRPEKGMLAGMWEFPAADGFLTVEEVRKQVEQIGDTVPFLAHSFEPIIQAKHIFTHVEWKMQGYLVEVSSFRDPPEDWEWFSRQDLVERIAIPSAYQKFTKYLLQEGLFLSN